MSQESRVSRTGEWPFPRTGVRIVKMMVDSLKNNLGKFISLGRVLLT
ncbi:hypothetical protein [Hydrocoleum sp. CS-953]|nr:hypothetical protein [Hydrocoleum sp. CS-953]